VPPRKPSSVGAHVFVAGGLSAAGLPYAARIGAEAVQVFVSNPRGWAASPGDPETSVCGPISTPEGPETVMAMPLSYPPTGLKAPAGYAVQVSPGTARLRATASDGSTQLVTPRVVDGRRYAAFSVGSALRLKRLTWLDAAGQAFASTTALPRYGYTQFQP